jgi:D-alanyl-D-alanine dipeptidase
MSNEVINSNPYLEDSQQFDKKLLAMPLIESGEPMTSVVVLLEQSGVDVSFSERQDRIYCLRERVAHQFVRAAALANEEGYVLQLEHAYRTVDTQQGLFAKRVQEVRQIFPEASRDEVAKAANMYTAGIPVLAAHLAGAAVDVLLLDRNRNPLPLGPSYPSGVKEATTDYPFLPPVIRANRKILSGIMESQGFVNYPFEYWHFSIGDVCAAFVSGMEHAVYSPISYDQDTDITTYLPEESYRSYFDRFEDF